eukprot:CAMPEP_0171332294 /NCGR_PEP_ID=MMETSP0878-20121228/3259_1 /TAXON_ID=67004 /ORGANISM="Thalassiosira weissflogii, Strain CCMP1336" /LENGTH=56 /DNA_ID=CAMNT_0011832993 /DNA_START=733 /DNA_END=903 /DNA_ORIENTATION=+
MTLSAMSLTKDIEELENEDEEGVKVGTERTAFADDEVHCNFEILVSSSVIWQKSNS